MISHVEFNPPPRKTSATAVVGGGDGRSALARRLITLVDKKNLKYLSRKIITIIMVYKTQTDIYIPALTRKIKNNTSVTQRYHFDFILQKGLGVAMTKTHEINSNLRQS